MPDLNKVLECLDEALKAVNRAQESMVPITAIKQVEAYVLGHLRCANTILQDARDAIQQSSAMQPKRRAKKDETPPET